jgi:hypothetical protein
MNVKRGLVRVWVLLSLLWLAAWGLYIWDSRLIATEDKTGRQFVAYHTDFGRGWTEPNAFSAADYLSLAGIGFGFPVLVLGFGSAVAWAIAGFRSN